MKTLKFCLGSLVALFCCSFGALAETIPATQDTSHNWKISGAPDSSAVGWPAILSVLTAAGGPCAVGTHHANMAYADSVYTNYHAATGLTGAVLTSGSQVEPVATAPYTTTTNCQTQRSSNGSWSGWFSPSGTNITKIIAGYVCPTGQDWTLNGSTCTRPDCAVGYDRNAQGQCVKNCTGKAGMATTNGSYSFNGAASTWSVSECKVYCPQRAISAYGGNGYGCKYTGASADPASTSGDPVPPDPEKLPPEEPKDCTGQGMGYIQTSTGVKCVASEQAPEGQKPDKVESDTKKETGKTGADGKVDPTAADYKKEETTNTRNSDGTTTTTKKETINGTDDGNGGTNCPSGYTASGTQCVKNTSATQDTPSFCKENPGDPSCKGSGSDPCDKNPELLSCKKLGAPSAGDGGNLNSQEVSPTALSPVAMSSSNSCPVGVEMPHGLGAFNWEPICDYATAFKPLVILFAWISAAMIVFGWSKN